MVSEDEMKKILLSMAAVAALGAAAVPAAAQPWRGDHDRYEGQRFTGRYDALEWQIQQAAQERRISWNEARELQRMWRDAQPLAWRVETGRASGWERQRVFNTMNRIERTLARSYAYSGYGRDWRR
jgi:Flp pilus assembly protein TadB